MKIPPNYDFKPTDLYNLTRQEGRSYKCHVHTALTMMSQGFTQMSYLGLTYLGSCYDFSRVSSTGKSQKVYDRRVISTFVDCKTKSIITP
jgi:hypothetical protein